MKPIAGYTGCVRDYKSNALLIGKSKVHLNNSVDVTYLLQSVNQCLANVGRNVLKPIPGYAGKLRTIVQ